MKINNLKDNEVLCVTKNDLLEAFREVLQNEEENSQIDKYIGIEEVSLITGYKRPTLYRFVQLKEIPYYKRKGRLCFKKNEIMEWIGGGKITV